MTEDEKSIEPLMLKITRYHKTDAKDDWDAHIDAVCRVVWGRFTSRTCSCASISGISDSITDWTILTNSFH